VGVLLVTVFEPVDLVPDAVPNWLMVRSLVAMADVLAGSKGRFGPNGEEKTLA
jgi:hypothetical protein